MSSTEPPAGSTPPPGDPTPPPPPAPDASAAPPPPPPPPPAGAASPMPGAPAAALGVPRPAELLDRFLARLIDGVILFFVGIILTVVLVGAIVASDSSAFFSWIIGLVFAVIAAAINLGYFAYMESSRGQTVGKQVMKLRTFGPDGKSNPTMAEAVRRNLYQGYAVLGVIPIVGGLIGILGYIAACILVAVGINGDAVKRQHWFDTFAGGTQVMKIG